MWDVMITTLTVIGTVVGCVIVLQLIIAIPYVVYKEIQDRRDYRKFKEAECHKE